MKGVVIKTISQDEYKKEAYIFNGSSLKIDESLLEAIPVRLRAINQAIAFEKERKTKRK